MSLDVNGVEIESLTVNGVEAETAYVNGVEVFKSSQGIYAENHGGYLISLDKGLVETSTTPTLGSGALEANSNKSYAFTDSFYFVLVSVSGTYYFEKISSVSGANLGRSPAFLEFPSIVIYNSKDGYIYAVSSNYISKILASDMTTSNMNVSVVSNNSNYTRRITRLSKDGDYIYFLHDSPSEYSNLYRIRCSDLLEDTTFYDGDTSGLGRISAATAAKDGYIYLIASNTFLYKIDPSTMNSVNFPDSSSRHGIFLTGEDVESIVVDGDFAYIGYSNGRLRKIELSDGTIISTVTTALDGQLGDDTLHIVVDGAYVYCACQGSGTSNSKLIDVRNSSDLSLFNTVNLSTTYGNWGIRSLSFRESPYDYLN